MRRFARRLMAVLVLLVVAAGGGFAWLQTAAGLAWFGRTAARALSSPGAVFRIEEVGGAVPFHLRAGRVEIGDGRGVWLALRDVRLDLSAAALLAGQVRFTRLTAASAEMRRLPVTPTPARPIPWSERLQLPHLSYKLAVDHFAVERVVLDPPVLGERVTMQLAGTADLVDRTARASLDLHRTDGKTGGLSLALKMGGAPQRLNLRLEVSEPSGLLLARLLHRADRPPLALSLTGDGPVADWHGTLRASAGRLAEIEAELRLKVSRGVTLQLSGNAAVAQLLPPGVAALLGATVDFKARGGVGQDGTVSLAALSVAAAAGTLTGDAEFGRPDRRIAGHLQLDLPHLAAAAAPVGVPVGGSARIDATLGGTETRPTLTLNANGDSVTLGTARIARATAHLAVTPATAGGTAAEGFRIDAEGDIRGLATPAMPPALTRDIGWSLAARSAADFGAVDITRFAARGAGIDIAGSGRVEPGGAAVDGKLHLAIADLSPLTRGFGKAVSGAIALDATASRSATGRVAATLAGSLTGLRSGCAVADALAGEKIALSAALHRDPGGPVSVDRLNFAGAGATLDGGGQIDPATRRVDITLDGKIPDLRSLGAAIGTRTAGRLAVTVKADGPADRLRVGARLAASDLAAGNARLDRLDLDAKVPDLSAPTITLTGRFGGGGLDGTLSLDGDARNPREFAIPHLRLSAAGSDLSGSLRIDRATGVVRGSLDGTVPDLGRWSRLAGMKLAGSIRLIAGLDARRGQGADVTLTGDRLAIGGTLPTIGHMEIGGKFADLRGRPFGHARASIRNAAFGSGALDRANLTLDARSDGHVAVAATAAGKLGGKFSLDLVGDGRLAPGSGAIEVRLSRLAGTIAGERLGLERPLLLRRGADALALAGLDLRFGPGRLTGDASIRGSALSLRLAASGLPLAPAAQLAGLRQASGTIGFTASLGGSTRAPHGQFSLTGRGLHLSGSAAGAATLGIDIAGDWNGRAVALNGRVLGLKGDTLDISGTVPLVMTAEPLRLATPRDGRFALRLRGAGDLASLADLLPLGEDRVSGHYALDAAATGTLAAPSGSGTLTVTGGRYENYATGAALSHLRLAIVGDQNGFVLRSLSADDGAQGSLEASGRLSLGGTHGPTAKLDARLSRFRLAARDQAVLTASGTLGIAGPLNSPEITADLTSDGGEFRIPDPGTTVTQLQVVRVGGPGASKPAAAVSAQSPALPARLNLRIAVPGRVFVRGHGIDSEWRGRLHVTGTTAAPQIAGAIQAVRGTVDLLGKTFQVSEGRIDFEGGSVLDPAINITAGVAARDITAQVVVSGLASAPKITLTSVPALPQDQILARVLFDRPLDQITVGEGLQVASAAATLAGGGPGVLDKLRSSLGLDRLVFGSGSGGASTGPAISGGKYIANGVYVGATQGLTAQSSKVTVDIDVWPHVTVQTDVGADSGTGIGLNYKYDY